MMKAYRYRPAFTLLEVIFVIVILGIVASLGSELIVKVYQQYIVQRAQHRASIKTELAATQIANRLASAIPGTVIRRLTHNAAAANWEYLHQAFVLGNPNDYNVLQWVGSDTDSFNYYDDATKKVGWSGFCDINGSVSSTSLSTPGSILDKAHDIMTNLAGGTLPTNSPSLYFPYDTASYPTASLSGGTETIGLNTPATHIVEHYKLAWSSYALVVDGGDLYLYYDFDPTPKVRISASSPQRSLLMKNISTFKFKGAGRTIRFKICKEEEIGEDFNITACKEKAVF